MLANEYGRIEFLKLGVKYSDDFKLKKPVGCKHCDGSGYSGRTAICDILTVNSQLRADIADNKALVADLRTKGKRKDKSKLRREGMRKVESGITSLQELKRVVG